MTEKTVTEEYLAGIRDGREYLQRFEPSEMEMRENLANIRETLKGFTGPVAEHLRGERDFWLNQLRKFQ